MKKNSSDILSFTSTQKKYISWAVLGIGGATLLGGTLYFANHWWQNVRANKERGKTLQDGTHEAKANQFLMAFANDGLWGTKVSMVRRIIRGIASWDEYNKIKKSYKLLSKGESLDADLEKELTTTEFEEMKAIMASKPPKTPSKGTGNHFSAPHLATRIYNALTYTWMGIPATDDDALKQAFADIPTQAAWQQVAHAYEQQGYGNMESDLDGDLWMFDDLDWEEIKASKPLQGTRNDWQKIASQWKINNYQHQVRQQYKHFLNQLHYGK